MKSENKKTKNTTVQNKSSGNVPTPKKRIPAPNAPKMPDRKPHTDRYFMKKALVQASHAAALGEVPIGCVIVCNDVVVGRGYNRRNTNKSSLAHAEITAIDRASRRIGDWRLEGCTMYVTLEPCQMCSGAIVQSRIDRVVIGAMNKKAGCAGSILNILRMPEFNHQVEITKGVLEEECTAVLQDFFKDLRVRNKNEKNINKDKNRGNE